MRSNRISRSATISRYVFGLILIGSFYAGPVFAQSDQGNLAGRLIELSERADCPRGVCAVPEGGALALDVAKASGFIVIAQAPDDAAAQRDRQAAYAAGLGGRRLYVAVAPRERFVASERTVDLLAMAAVTDESLKRLDRAEVERVLSPQLGRAVIGHAQGAAGTLSRSALERWAQGPGMTGRIIEDAQGLWLILERDALPGSDDWPHAFHDAGGNAVSHDAAFADPFSLAWTAKPFITSRLQIRVAAGGRLFSIFRRHQAEGMFQTHSFEGSNELVARNIHNGEILWRYPIGGEDARRPKTVFLKDGAPRLESGDEVYTQRSSLIATSSQVFLIRKAGVQVLDAATGAEQRLIMLGGIDARPKWIYLADGILVILAGPEDPPEFSPTANVMKTIGLFAKLTAEAKFGFGREIVAVEAATGKQLWRHTESAPVDGRVFGVAAGRIVGYAPGSRVFALDLRSGKEAWRQAAPEQLAALSALTPVDNWGWNSVSGPGLVCNDQVAAIAHAGSREMVVLSMDDGRLLWKTERKGAFPIRACLWQDRLLAVRTAAPVMDARTGAAKSLAGGAGARISTCGGFTATVRYAMGLSGPVMDLQDGRSLAPPLAKADCSVGNLVASGTFVQAPPACSTCNHVYGFLAMRSFPGYDLSRPATDAERLVSGADARDPRSEILAPQPADWPTYRANTRRTGASQAALPAQSRLAWTWKPSQPFPPAGIEGHYSLGAEHRATAPVAVGDRVFLAATDGSIVALSANDGKGLWRYLAGGRIMSSPAVYEGRVYAGGADGQVYCLDAASGALFWRFRVAPLERRTMIYGHLTSLWPVTGTPLVEGGVVYASAGQPMSVGGYVVALDAATGKLRWERAFVPFNGADKTPDPATRGKTPAEKLWISPWGQLALSDGILHVRIRNSTGIPGLALDAATGAVKSVRLADQNQGGQSFPYMRGQDLGVLPDGRLVSGGMEPEFEQMAIGRMGRTVAVSSLADNAANTKTGRTRMPVWNDRIAIQPASGYALGLAAMSLDSWAAANTAATRKKVPAAADAAAPEKEDSAGAPAQWLWGPFSPDGKPFADKHGARGTIITAMALAANGLVAVYPEGASIEKADYGLTRPWKAAGFALEDGRRIWEVALPGPAILDGVCIGRDGAVYVTLLDGGVCALSAAP